MLWLCVGRWLSVHVVTLLLAIGVSREFESNLPYVGFGMNIRWLSYGNQTPIFARSI